LILQSDPIAPFNQPLRLKIIPNRNRASWSVVTPDEPAKLITPKNLSG
jgi:hypothetical protein